MRDADFDSRKLTDHMHSCSRCAYYTKLMNSSDCKLRDKVSKVHGPKRLNRWLGKAEKKNNCSLFGIL